MSFLVLVGHLFVGHEILIKTPLSSAALHTLTVGKVRVGVKCSADYCLPRAGGSGGTAGALSAPGYGLSFQG